jgi:hypothetical protein
MSDRGSHEEELKGLLEEIRSLRQDIEILKANPTIGQAVDAALHFGRRQPDHIHTSYNVAASPTRLPERSYAVLV